MVMTSQIYVCAGMVTVMTSQNIHDLCCFVSEILISHNHRR